ncbi:esterase EstB [Opitutia bacterium]|nr:esterase EstB [Opitutae bacterium]
MSLSRRRFLGLSAALAAAPGAWAQTAEVTATGERVPELAAFDELMDRFVREQGVPGAGLAIAHRGQTRYARGFGLADRDTGALVRPTTRFRIASVSKPFTAVAILKLVEHGKLGIDDPVLPLLGHPAKDPRWARITVRHCLQHRGGWDRAISGDPISQTGKIFQTTGIPPPHHPSLIVRYMLRQPLDFDPGARMAYSNLGYLVLGRIIEKISGVDYEDHVRAAVLKPLGLNSMKLGKATWAGREPDEARYHTRDNRKGLSLYDPFGQPVPVPYGTENFEGFEAHGGWIASATDLVRFADAFHDPAKSPLLKPETFALMQARPEGAAGHEEDGKPKAAYYGCGWMVRPVKDGQVNLWHAGLIAGSEALLVRRWDGWSWAVLFNANGAIKHGTLAATIDPLLHRALGR